MSNDKRSVTTDALETLGTIIGENEKRDAIHLAVEPVIAGHDLKPGDHIKLVDGKAVKAMPTQGLGIVDPFIDGIVTKGERFWLVVYPRKITSLRHVWSHPEFAEADIAAAIPNKSASEVWMRAWAVEHMGDDYYGDSGDTKLSEHSAYALAIEAGHSTHIGPYESARDYIDNEWWTHWEAITGAIGKRGEYFSCSC